MIYFFLIAALIIFCLVIFGIINLLPSWIVWDLIILAVGYYIGRIFFGLRAIQDCERIATDLTNDLGDCKEKCKNEPPSSSSYHKNLRHRLHSLTKTFNEYLHLREQYKYNIKRFVINLDWYFYQKAHSKLIECDRDYGILSDEKLLKNTAENQHKAEILIEETEKRFKQLLKV